MDMYSPWRINTSRKPALPIAQMGFCAGQYSYSFQTDIGNVSLSCNVMKSRALMKSTVRRIVFVLAFSFPSAHV